MKIFLVNEIVKSFEKTNGSLSTGELKHLGLTAYNIDALVKNGILERTKRGLYSLPEKINEMSELISTSKIVPQGILCLLSSLSWHDLTTHIPKEYSYAIPLKSRKPVSPVYPPIQVYYFSDLRYNTGQITVDINGYQLSIYDKEKTICDIVFYRNKIGQDIVREALEKYIQKKDKNIQKLMQYAEKLRVSATLKKYLEVLI